MKRFFALLIALTMLLSCTAFAGEFNAGVSFSSDSDGNTTIQVEDSDLFDTRKVTLTVDCDLETAYVVFEGKAVTSTLDEEEGKITFAVIDGGVYTIKAGVPSEDELPEEPETPDQPDQPDTPTNPDTPDTPDGRSSLSVRKRRSPLRRSLSPQSCPSLIWPKPTGSITMWPGLMNRV